MILTDSRKELKEHYAGRREHFKEQYKSLTAYCTKYKEGYNE